MLRGHSRGVRAGARAFEPRPLEYAGYLVLYVAVFMLDDLAVLVAALKTLEVTGLTTRYARWSNAVGASPCSPSAPC